MTNTERALAAGNDALEDLEANRGTQTDAYWVGYLQATIWRMCNVLEEEPVETF
jgi:hypothetical protein